MSLARVANVVGLLQVFVSLSMFVAAGVAFVYGDGDALGILLAGAVTFFVGGFTYALTMFEGELTPR